MELAPSPRPPVETLSALLALFRSPYQAGRAAGRRPSAGYAWYPRGGGTLPRAIPDDRSIVKMAESAGLTDWELGRIYRDVAQNRRGPWGQRGRASSSSLSPQEP